MRPKLALLLSIIVVVPLATTAWLGYRMALDEQEMVRHRVRELLEQPLREKDRTIASFRDTRQREMLYLARQVEKVVEKWIANDQNNNSDSLLNAPIYPNMAANNSRAQSLAQQGMAMPRQQLQMRQQAFIPRQWRSRRVDVLPESVRDELLTLCRRQPTIRQLFVLGDDGKLLYPNPKNPKSEKERAFLTRTQRLWDEGQRFWQPSDQSKKGQKQNYGWHVWYWGRGMNLIFWLRQTSGAVIGIEMDRTRLISDVIALLPDTNPQLPTLNGLVILRDARGGKLYEWGAYVPAKNEKPRVFLHLSYPFNAWQMEYYAKDVDGLLQGGMQRSLILGLLALAIALLWMAFSFFREYTREIREAQQRVNFVNQVSHELKTPLTNIRMYAELLDDELLEEDIKANKYLAVIVSESQRLSRLIGNVLSFARHRRKKLKIRRTSGVVDEVVRSVLDRFRPSLEAKDLIVEFNGNATNEAFFDGDALEQVLGNLVSNVEKYGASGGTIQIKTSLQNDLLTLTVKDDGPGIKKELHEEIFKPFFRASDKLTEGAAGTGIGLAIARELARLHGGDLCVLGTDKGATFQLTLVTKD